MSAWADALLETIAKIPFAPYGKGFGVTEDVLWDGRELLKAAGDPRSNCSGSVMEALVKTFKEIVPEDRFTWAQMQQLANYVYMRDYIDPRFLDGGPEGLIQLGIAERVENPEDAQAGDIAEIYWEPDINRAKGHAVVILGVVDWKGVPAINTWSANLSNVVEDGEPLPIGHRREKFKIHKGSRQISVARVFLDRLLF